MQQCYRKRGLLHEGGSATSVYETVLSRRQDYEIVAEENRTMMIFTNARRPCGGKLLLPALIFGRGGGILLLFYREDSCAIETQENSFHHSARAAEVKLGGSCVLF